MLSNKEALKLAKKHIRKEPMPSSLEQEFKKNGLEHLLEDVYQRTAELIQDNQNANKALMMHLEQILPSIAFCEILLMKEGNQEQALRTFEKWCYIKIEKMARMIPVLMKIPGLYKKVPAIMRVMLDKLFGYAAGFDYIEKEQENGFVADMTLL